MSRSPGFFIVVGIILVVRSGIVFATFRSVDFQKQYSDPDDVMAQRVYARKQNIQSWRSELQQQQDQYDSPGETQLLTTSTIKEVISETMDTQTHAYDHSNTMSFDDILASISTDSLQSTTHFTSTKQLEEQYALHQEPSVALALITKLSKEYNYARAYELLQTLDSTMIKNLSPHLILRILFNSDLIKRNNQDLTTIENMIAQLRASNHLSIQDAQWYTALLLLAKGDKKAFLEHLPEYETTSESPIKGFAHDLRQKLAQSTQGHDIPAYYSDGMIALGMFQYGYTLLAQELSLQLLLEYPHYILPKQILAYSHMILHDWSQAQSYFLQLIESDSKNIVTYQFFAGVCAYWLEKYNDAILYLNQIPAEKVVSDAIRYKILSSIALKDTISTAKYMKSLLSYPDLNNSDMMLAWEQLIFEPYMTQSGYAMIQYDSNLLPLYVEQCDHQQLDATICMIGHLAKDIGAGHTHFSPEYLKTIISKFPRSYLYYLLGESYLAIDQRADAQKSFISAISLTNNPTIRATITAKITTLL